MTHITPVVFPSGSALLSGRIYRNTTDLTQQQPVVLVTGSWLTVKEQMAHLYAQALAEKGYTAFTFDFAGFGDSEGVPRQLELPARKINDIVAAAEYTNLLGFAKPGATGLLAICASAQYGLAALARGAAIRSFASVAGWFHDPATIALFYGGTEGVAMRLGWADQAAAAWSRERKVEMAPAYHIGDMTAGMYFELDYYANPQRGAIAAWRNKMNVMTWRHWLCFDGIRSASAVATPTVFVHSDNCALPDNVRRVYGALRGPKQLVWGSGSQIDYYDQPNAMQFALDAAHAHFQKTL